MGIPFQVCRREVIPIELLVHKAQACFPWLNVDSLCGVSIVYPPVLQLSVPVQPSHWALWGQSAYTHAVEMV